MSTSYSWITRAKTIGKSRCGRHRYQALCWCPEWLIPSPAPPAASQSQRFSLFQHCPFWLSGLCMETRHKYQNPTSFTGCLTLVIGPRVGKKGKRKSGSFSTPQNGISEPKCNSKIISSTGFQTGLSKSLQESSRRKRTREKVWPGWASGSFIHFISRSNSY